MYGKIDAIFGQGLAKSPREKQRKSMTLGKQTTKQINEEEKREKRITETCHYFLGYKLRKRNGARSLKFTHFLNTKYSIWQPGGVS